MLEDIFDYLDLRFDVLLKTQAEKTKTCESFLKHYQESEYLKGKITERALNSRRLLEMIISKECDVSYSFILKAFIVVLFIIKQRCLNERYSHSLSISILVVLSSS